MKASYKKVKIIATVGPASNSPEMVRQLIENGVNVFRLNFSHGSLETHHLALTTIRQQSKILAVEVAVLADLQGPKIRTGITPDNKPVLLSAGSKVTLTTNLSTICTDSVISIDYKNLPAEISAGQIVMINDGATSLLVDSISGGTCFCTVLSSGMFSSHKGVNFPDVDLSIPSLTKKDENDLSFILENDFQYIALSFVRKAADIQSLQNIVQQFRSDIKIIAKIEKPEAARKIDEILEVADGIMVARGDLGVETSMASVPIIQKQLIDKANRCGKLVIVATQMLESMINAPVPTRAESTDVANAVIDGADAIMLSGETAMGAYPVLAVQMMSKIARFTENSDYVRRELINLSTKKHFPPHAICEAANWACRDLGNIPVCVFSLTGNTADYMSKIRVTSPIFAFTPNRQILKQLSLVWNVVPFYLEFDTDVNELHAKAENLLLKADLVKKGDLIAHVSGTTPIAGATNTLRIKKVGEE